MKSRDFMQEVGIEYSDAMKMVRKQKNEQVSNLVLSVFVIDQLYGMTIFLFFMSVHSDMTLRSCLNTSVYYLQIKVFWCLDGATSEPRTGSLARFEFDCNHTNPPSCCLLSNHKPVFYGRR